MIEPEITQLGLRIGEVFKTLEAIPLGKEKVHALKFQNTVNELLKILFDDHLEFIDSRSVHNETHITDGVFEIKQDAKFVWKEVKELFRTFVVIVECKNYRNKIHETEILLTEKYLNPTAFHSFCILVARNGWTDKARATALSALRSSGKMILLLDMSDLREMKNRAVNPLLNNTNDPNKYIREKLPNHFWT